MSDDLYEVWRDDRLIEAAARGDLLELEDDPAAGPLVALAVLADGGSPPRLDVDEAVRVDPHTSQRYAVRSLAVAVTVVATLSTSGVAAVVTGDPFRPAKAVWHQIQDHTGLRSAGDGALAGSGAALGAPAVPRGVDASKPSELSMAPGAPPPGGLTARAPEHEAGAEAASWERAQASAAEGSAAGQGTQPYSEDDTQSPEQQDRSQQPAEPTGGEQQEPGEDSGSQPAPEDEQPAPDDQSDDDGLEELVPPGAPDDGQDDGTPPGDADGDGDDQTVPGESSSQPTPGAVEDGGQDTADGAADGAANGATTAPPPTLAP